MSQNKKSLDGPKLSQFDIDNFKRDPHKELIESIQEYKSMPWNNARMDVNKFINVRMPEEYFMKLDYVSKKHRISKNKLCLEAVIAEIERMLGE